MTFSINQAIQINEGLNIEQTVYSVGKQFGGSSDTAISLAIAARGIGIIVGITNSASYTFYQIKWQGSQFVYGYEVSAIEANFNPISGVWFDALPFK